MTPTHPPFGERLTRALNGPGGCLCLGLDPHPQLLRAWGLADTVAGVERFSRTVVQVAAGSVAMVKPQAAFFERHGSGGIAVLERVLRDLADAGVLSVLDAKRGDIGSTMQGYADAYLADGAPLAADALTVNPYLGVGALEPAITLARRNGRGLFVLALTSNQEAASVQHAGRPPVALRVVQEVAALNAGNASVGDIGLVIGATTAATAGRLGIDLRAANAPLLAPGVGAQGATTEDVDRDFAGVRDRLVVPIGRAVLEAGPDPLALRDTVGRWVELLGASVSD